MRVRKWHLLILILTCLSCARNNPAEQLKNLNGYWEIKEVNYPQGGLKEYGFSEQIDYIAIQDSTGFRTKVLPRLDGSFLTSGSKEQVQIKIQGNTLRLIYKTPFDTWEETVIKATQDELQLRNARGLIYTYKKHKPLSINL